MTISLRYAYRSLRREPALVLGVVLTFAIAIGATGAMFGLVTRLMLAAPSGVAEPSRVARAALHLQDENGEKYVVSTTSYPVFQAMARRTDAFAATAAVHPETMVMGRAADALEVRAIAASGQYFAVLGARPVLGRFFTEADDQVPSGDNVAVLSYAFWKARFGGQENIAGTSIVLDGATFVITGVAQPDFSGDGIDAVDIFVPLTVAMRGYGAGWSIEPDLNLVSIVARLRDGVTAASAGARATSAARSVQEGRIQSIDLESLLPSSVRSSASARIARWLLGVSLAVLLIATANVGTLLLLRAARKRRDVAVRMALGAGRGQLALQLTTESLLLALAGGAVGMLVSRWLADIARVTLLPDLAPSDRLVEPRVLVASTVLAVVAGLLAGLAPLFLIAHRRLAAELHGAGTLGSIARSRMQRVLVGTQVALCTVLLVGAGLFVRSLQRIQGQQLGFSTTNLMVVRLDFRDELTGKQQDDVYFDAARRLAGAAGIAGATVIDAFPFGNHAVPPISVPGLSEPPSAGGQLPMMYGATPTYLKLLGVTLLRGRLLTQEDRAGSQPVVLVNETMAREVWPGQSAIGKCIRIGMDPSEEPSPMASPSMPCREVVGVVRNSRARSLRPVGREATLMQYYVPFGQLPPAHFSDAPLVSGLLVGVGQGSDVERVMPMVQRLIQGAVATPVYARVQPYQDLLDPQLRPWRLGATLFVLFGALALAIAAVGLAGVISYLVTQRTREIGLRLALGGTTADIARSVVFAALRMVAIGAAVGLATAVAVGPTAAPLLFETSPHDVSVLLSAVALLGAVTVAAAAWPAWRAARVSPMVALRAD